MKRDRKVSDLIVSIVYFVLTVPLYKIGMLLANSHGRFEGIVSKEVFQAVIWIGVIALVIMGILRVIRFIKGKPNDEQTSDVDR